jgi:hypothetical protein
LSGRSGKHDAADGRQIEALCQDHTVGNDFGLVGCQAGKDSVAVDFRREAVDVFGTNARFRKFVFDVN